jgi:translation initiation factor IF-1
VAKSQEVLRVEGTVVETLRDAGFRVRFDDAGEVIVRKSGRMRGRRRIRIIPGDRVDLELSIYHPTKGRIGWRHKSRPTSNPFLEMNHRAGQGAGHSLHRLDLGDDQLPERINVIGSNASNHVVWAGNNDGGGNAVNLPHLGGDLWRFLDVGLDE